MISSTKPIDDLFVLESRARIDGVSKRKAYIILVKSKGI